LINRILWTLENYTLDKQDSLLQIAATGFDISIWEILFPILGGACLVVANEKHGRDIEYLVHYIIKNKISTIHFIPSLLDVMLDQINFIKLSYIKKVICGGESISQALREKFIKNFKASLHHAYGPTEASISVTHWNCNNNWKESVPIGSRISNITTYILDSNLNIVPIRAIGELYIGGVGLARGYLNKAGLTAEKFVANPFQTEKERKEGRNGRLYKTGDLARWGIDGNIEYVGRNDYQVKIRGYRIELGEIEAELLTYQGIEQVVVIAREHKGIVNGNKYLVGYYVSKEELEEEVVIDYLRNKLPDYMVPSVLVKLEALPLTVNGKLDRKALPDPEFTDEDSYVAPRNEVERKICKIWAEVLGLDANKVGIKDDFFRLGGNSILAIKLINKLNSEFNTDSYVSYIFQYNTIDILAKEMKITNSEVRYSKKIEV